MLEELRGRSAIQLDFPNTVDCRVSVVAYPLVLATCLCVFIVAQQTIWLCCTINDKMFYNMTFYAMHVM